MKEGKHTMKYEVKVTDEQTKDSTVNLVVARKRTSLVTIALKGLENHLANHIDSDNEETLKLANSIKRECNNDLDVFLEDISTELDYSIVLVDLNDHIYENTETGERTTSLDVGKRSYYMAWESQVNNEDGVKDFLSYLPDSETLIAHGNEMMMPSIVTENSKWEIVEEE